MGSSGEPGGRGVSVDAGGILLLLSGAFLLDRDADAPVSPGRRGPLLVFLAVAVGLFAAAEVVGAVLRNYIAGASLWVAGIVVLLAAGTWAVAGVRGSKETTTALRRAGVLATVVAGAALVVAGYLIPVGMFSEAFVSARADRLISLEIPQHWTGIAFDAVFPVTVVVLALAVALRALGSRMSPAIRAILFAMAATVAVHHGNVGRRDPSGRDLGCRRLPRPRRRSTAPGQRPTGPAARCRWGALS
jgi:hypothetical protein